jgi:TP901 family phage tail tape measure protein
LSELIAEARVLVRPDTTAFRAELVRELAVATRGITAPVQVVPVAGAGTAAAAATTLAGAQRRVADETRGAADAAKNEAAERRAAAAATAEHTRQLNQLQRGAAASALALTGVRGATLAATGPFLAGAAAVTVFAKSIQSSANLEASLNVFAVTAEATADQMDRIRDVAIELGADLSLPGVTAQSAADALAQLSRAGLDVEDSVAGVRGTLQLATAAAIDNESAVTLVANALNAFSLAGADATRVADLLAAASKESQGSIVDVGLAFQQSAAAAAQAGLTVEDTIALLTELGRAGLRGSDAGTSLRTALIRLIAPSKQAKEALEGLGVAVRDQAGNVRPEVFAEITDQLNRMTKAQEDATLALIFGQDAFRAASILGRAGAQGLNEMREATQEAGAAAELAAARTQGLAGAFENLKNQGATLGLAIGDAVKGPLTDFLNFTAEGIQNINTFVGFLGRIAGTSDEAAESIGDLTSRVNSLSVSADNSVAGQQRLQEAIKAVQEEFVSLIQEAGNVNLAVANRGAEAGQGLLDRQKEVNAALEATQPAALTARDGIESYRGEVALAADAVEGLINRIDEGRDRFAKPLPTPQEPEQRRPPTIGPTAKLDARAQLAAAREDLQALERVQEVQLENAKRAFENSKGNIEQRTRLFNEVAAADSRLISTRRQIDAKQDAERKAAAAERERLAREREQDARQEQQDLVASLERVREAQQVRITDVGLTESLRDDIRETQDLRRLIQDQIKLVRSQVTDERTRTAAIDSLTSARNATNTALKRLAQEEREAREERAQQAKDQIAENLSLRTQIAQARGDEDAVVAALDAEIANQRKRVAAAKKAGEGVLEETLALERLRAQRRDLLEEAKEAVTGGTTLADLFNRAREIAGGAGNVGQTASGLRGLSATPRIQSEVQQRLDIVSDPAKAAAARQTQATNNLITAINQLTQAITGQNAPANGTGRITRRDQNAFRNLSEEQRFFYQKQAKMMVEQGLVG